MRVFLTKYALTEGIQEIEAEKSSGQSEMISWGRAWTQCAHKGEWFEDIEEAIANAERRRDRRLASLRLQVAKLEKMSFSGAVRADAQ